MINPLYNNFFPNNFLQTYNFNKKRTGKKTNVEEI
jgi:hypothetical protein